MMWSYSERSDLGEAERARMWAESPESAARAAGTAPPSSQILADATRAAGPRR